MHLSLRLGIVLALTLSLRAAVGIDDTYQQVITAKGQPAGKIEAGDSVILRYADETIRLKGGKVVAIEAAKNPPPASVVPVVARSAASSRPQPSPAASAVAGKPAWRTDYQAAMVDAKAQNRRVFLFFTGSDWCGWCVRLQREILTTSEFAQFANENLVLIELDFPRKKTLPAALRSQNTSLAQRYRIRGYPTVVVLDSNGQTLGTLGYQEGGPGPFIAKVKSL